MELQERCPSTLGSLQQNMTLTKKLEIDLSFDESAIDEIIRQAMETDQKPSTLIFYMTKKLEYGLKLVRERSGVEKFVIDREAVIDIENYINNLVKKVYRQDYDAEILLNLTLKHYKIFD